MTTSVGTAWRFLVVEDNADNARQLQEVLPGAVDLPDSAKIDLCRSFGEARTELLRDRYDILILDLKDDSSSFFSSDSEPAGVKIFEELRKTRFVPVVFYTAHAQKVRSEETSFVRVVEKSEDVTRVREEVRKVLATRLPALNRQIEEVQRSYMWEFVSTNWKEFKERTHQADLAYLLARRLAISLEHTAKDLAVFVGGQLQATSNEKKSHPMVMYVTPPIGPHRLAGDILLETVNATQSYWLILTPSCDFAQEKVHHVVLAKCERLTEQDEYKKWSFDRAHRESKSRLEDLIGDNRRSAPGGPKLQPERFKFLPGTFFLPDLVVDFQQLRSLGLKDLAKLAAVASLDSPFAESVLARFARYYGRLGTPDLDREVVFRRIEEKAPSTARLSDSKT